MTLPDLQSKTAVPLAKLKQYFDRIRLSYTERRSGNATIIQVQSNRARRDDVLAPHRVGELNKLRF